MDVMLNDLRAFTQALWPFMSQGLGFVLYLLLMLLVVSVLSPRVSQG